MAGRSGYFARLESILSDNKILPNEIEVGAALNEKSVRKMIKKSGYSSEQSVRKVVDYLNSKGLKLNFDHEFVESK